MFFDDWDGVLRAVVVGLCAYADPTHAEAVVLETDGSFSIVRDPARGPHSTLVDVSGADQPR